MKQIWLGVAAIGLVIVASLGGAVYAKDTPAHRTFGTVPDPENGSSAPAFSAVEDHDGTIAGYVNTELIESGGPAPSTPAEALEQMASVRGDIFEVFDTQGEIVGYFASGPHGFISSAEKDALVRKGFRLLQSAKPVPEP